VIPYQKEKLENAVCFFAVEHNRRARHHLYQTFLYKYLALFDFGYLRAYGKPALGLTYKAMKMGPVPIQLYGSRNNEKVSDCFSMPKDEAGNIIIVPHGKPNLDYFNKREIDLMNKLIEIYAQSYVTSHIMSDSSHEEILAWKRAWKQEQNSIIDFSLEFSGNVYERPEDNLTFPEEVFLIQEGLENCR